MQAASMNGIKMRNRNIMRARSYLTTNSPTRLQESAQPYLLQECRGNTESWDRGWNLELEFLHGAWNFTGM